jgi:uncharacterized phage protein (TIGR01671 family)
MNRERKYRVWDISHKTFLPTYAYALITSDFGAFGIMLKDWDNYKEGEYLYPNSQIQSDFTGLLDKNGKEIYEGDVLKIFNTEGFGVVKFFACSFMVEWVGQDCYSDLLGWYNFKRGAVSKPEDFEIIGNIYENKKLIN